MHRARPGVPPDPGDDRWQFAHLAQLRGSAREAGAGRDLRAEHRPVSVERRDARARRAIVEALRVGDQAAAEKAIDDHLSITLRTILTGA